LERLRVEYERLQQPAEKSEGNVVSEPLGVYKAGLFREGGLFNAEGVA